MYEFHGWITIRESTGISEEDKIDEKVDKIKSFINKLAWMSGVLDIRAVNGTYHLLALGLTNHRGQEADDIFNLFQYIGNIAHGSYGLLYIRDDEDTKGNDNRFQVFVLTRGNLYEREDLFLSPFVPIVEDEYMG